MWTLVQDTNGAVEFESVSLQAHFAERAGSWSLYDFAHVPATLNSVGQMAVDVAYEGDPTDLPLSKYGTQAGLAWPGTWSMSVPEPATATQVAVLAVFLFGIFLGWWSHARTHPS